jgi:hypothetical protein
MRFLRLTARRLLVRALPRVTRSPALRRLGVAILDLFPNFKRQLKVFAIRHSLIALPDGKGELSAAARRCCARLAYLAKQIAKED